MTNKPQKWSYSRVSSYKTCPYAYKLKYIDHLKETNNVFSQYGSFVHGILEKFAKGELAVFELEDAYIEGYEENVTLPFPPSPPKVDLPSKYFEDGLRFFQTFEGFSEEIVNVEEEFTMTIEHEGYEPVLFTGFIDVILKDNGDIIIQDWKSKGKFKSKKERAEYFRQLYLYSFYVKEKYQIEPKRLILYLFRSQEKVIEAYDPEKAIEAKLWLLDTINEINKATEYPTAIELCDTEAKERSQSFFCKFICGVAAWDCPNRSE